MCIRDRVKGIKTAKGEVHAETVILAAGAWSPIVGKELGINVPIKPRRGQIIITEPVAPYVNGDLLSAQYIVAKHHPETLLNSKSRAIQLGVGLSLTQTAKGDILIGATREFVDYDKRNTREGIREVLKNATRIVPGLKAVSYTHLNEGTILYINKAFAEITKNNPSERIGKNVFDVSPNGALAEVLRTGKPVVGKLNKVLNTGVEVMSNASPLIVNGNMQGAVVLFRNVSDMKKISRKLEESQEVIRNLKEEIRELAAPRYSFEDIIGKSQALEKQLQIARFAAKDAETILLTGESGTGKELLALSLIHI